MTNSKTTKRALLTSVMALVLCFAMLTGTTFAWFTDTETSANNRIVAGNLDIDLLMYDAVTANAYVSIAENPETDVLKIFSETKDGVWEPGKTEIVYLAVQNLGNLALKYNIIVDITDEGLKDALEYAIADGVKYGDLASVTNWTEIKTNPNAQVGDMKGIVDNKIIAAENGVLDEVLNNVDKETQYFALAIHMKEEAGNEFKSTSVGINVTLVATQVEAEADAFSNEYDKDATYSGVAIPADAVKVNTYQELSDALASGGNITLAADIEVTSSLDITKDVDLYAVDGTTLSFASTAQMKVKDGATLKLMNVTVDNGDTFGFDADGKFYIADVAGRNTAAIFDVSAGSELSIEKATTISNVVGKSQAVVMANGTTVSRATVTVKGTIKKCAGITGSVICANKCTDVYIEDGAVLKENVSYNSHNYGLIKIYDGSMFYMNGGEITKNLYAGNGLIGFQSANAEINGGIIHNNNYYDGNDSIIDSGNAINSRHGLIYAHSNSEFVINGGEIINNTVTEYGALDCMRKPTVTLVVNGGTVKNNLSREAYYSEDTDITYDIGTEFFGTITSEDHITLSKDAQVSGLIQDFSAGDDIYIDVTTLAE